MDPIAEQIANLRSSPQAYTRCFAVDSLSHHLDQLRVVEALIEALSDEGAYEVEEPGAQSHLYTISGRAAEALRVVIFKHFTLLSRIMQNSPRAMWEGLELMTLCKDEGLEILLESLDSSDPEIARRAASVLAAHVQSSEHPDPKAVEAFFRTVLHPDALARAAAIDKLPWYFQKRPELDPLKVVPSGFLEALAQALCSGGVRSDAAWPFLSDDSILLAVCKRVAEGDEQSAYRLEAHVDRLSDSAITSLLQGQRTAGLLWLWGAFGERGTTAIPALLESLSNTALTQSAVVSLLKLPGGPEYILPRINDMFMELESVRGAIVLHHPLPQSLAQEVIPRLREQWSLTKNRSALRGLRTLGPLMKSEMPWLLTQLEPYLPDKTPRNYAIEIVSTFGTGAYPAFEKLKVLLEDTDARSTVLKALIKLGPVAIEFLPRIEALEKESRTWSGWQKNWWRELVVEAFNSLGG